MVKTYYAKFMSETCIIATELASKDENMVVWKAKMPPKMKIFTWRLIKDRLPTRMQLFTRNIIADKEQCRCVYSCPVGEDLNHLFLSCDKLRKVWRRINIWLEITMEGGADCCDVYMIWFEALNHKILAKMAGVIWEVMLVHLETKE